MSNYNELDLTAIKSILDMFVKSTAEVPKTKCEKHKIYFAGPWFTPKAKCMYDACVSIINNLKSQGRLDRLEIYIPRDSGTIWPRETFDSNVEHVKNCDTVIALVDEKDVGTAWEIGMAYALNKQIFLLGYDSSTFESKTNLMLAYTGKCVRMSDFEDLLLDNVGNIDEINVNRTWENIE